MGQMDRDYWRKRYNEKTAFTQKEKPLRESKGFFLALWCWATSWRTICSIWLLIFVLHVLRRYV
ncbi:hypothetical protein SDC9_62309 [bioreactor metagenome]|uniref:Uncharacterized protein n=1 Tax=bioreactor metagenome TaxID=1076179 RepID=A0A644XIB4_9ZZZZ